MSRSLLLTGVLVGLTAGSATAGPITIIVGDNDGYGIGIVDGGVPTQNMLEAFDYSQLDAQAVPEPATLLLLGAGLTVVAARLRRRPA